MAQDSGIPVRRSARFEIVLPARITVCPAHARQARFVQGITDGEGCVKADLIDLSLGGVGLLSTHFFPKQAKLRLRVYGLNGDKAPALLDGHIRIQRITMTDSRPGYLLGGCFVDTDGVFDRDLDLLLNRLDNDIDNPGDPAEEAA